MKQLSPVLGQRPIALYLLHVGSMDSRLIGLSVERHWSHSVHVANSLDEARVALVDCDRPGSEAAFELLARHPRTAVVCYAFHPKDHAQRFPNRIILDKPLNLEALPTLLTQAIDTARRGGSPLPRPHAVPERAPVEPPSSLGHGLQAIDERDLCGGQEDLALAPGAALPDKLFFDPDQYLIGPLSRAVREATRSGRPQTISGLPRLIGVLPKPLPICVTAFRDNQLRPFSMTQLPQATTRIVSTMFFSETTESDAAYAAEDFLWNIAAWAARGRLPKGSDPYQPVRLKAWPNFTQVFVSPHALRIAALWTRNWATPIEIATQLAVPHRYVFSVYASARFAGLLEERPREISPPVPAAPPSAPPQAPVAAPPRPSILSRILRKLLHAI